MFQKIAPLIVLALFVIATIFIMQGLEKASAMTHPKPKITHQQGE
ncbi:hypothetical protein [Nitratifractor salsuginis]|uniref:Uncharacterized protein n=1 Tax=Nitratifractor salsuginis (strain DSM 16511 / JCM 12458 / E9I37-1) TaxID=749222 RepID=E6WXU6_NITSE|nr:hypothetical protein [Nitratifractor salsuginis]ADV46353.1 hypothetical protein Nitsa_1097 [Nitratifractor salsuginis DSM 16511]